VLRKLATERATISLHCHAPSSPQKISERHVRKSSSSAASTEKMTNESLYEFISKNDLGFLELDEMLISRKSTWKSSRSVGCKSRFLSLRVLMNKETR
jgi:hypothetical protein